MTDVNWIKEQHKQMCEDIDDLRKFKWTIYGVSIVLSLVVSAITVYMWH